MGDVIELAGSVKIDVPGLAEKLLSQQRAACVCCFPLSRDSHSDSLTKLCNSCILFSASHLNLIIDFYFFFSLDLPEIAFFRSLLSLD